ncbi:hypothetical protein FI667_g12775, partial [Globisporangium splendens]
MVASPARSSVDGVNEQPSQQAKASGAANDRRLKLQHFLVMKAFNLRKDKHTVNQQFQFLEKSDNNQVMIMLNSCVCLATAVFFLRPFNSVADGRMALLLESQGGRAYLDELCQYLCIPPFRRLVLCQVFQLPPNETRLDFDMFVRFLQSAAVHAAEEEKQLQKNYSTHNLPKPPSALESVAEPTQLVCFQPTLLSSQPGFSHPPPAPGLWKKREITIQERITEYTKIDEHGRPQLLIEKEKHQTEVIHMENLQGEFVHQEITHFEQTEQLNGEIVHHEHGREEFVHLKSEHDEISRFESSIPTGSGAARPEECEQPPPSPTIKRDPSVVGGDDGCENERHGFDENDFGGGDTDCSATGMMEEEYYQYQRQQEAERCQTLGEPGHQGQFDMETMQ